MNCTKVTKQRKDATDSYHLLHPFFVTLNPGMQRQHFAAKQTYITYVLKICIMLISWGSSFNSSSIISPSLERE